MKRGKAKAEFNKTNGNEICFVNEAAQGLLFLLKKVNELIEELINEAAGPTTYNLLCRNLKNEVLQ